MKRIHTIVFGAGIFAALGFGSASAFAKPTTARAWFTCPYKPPTEGQCVTCCENFEMHDYQYDQFTNTCRCWSE
jgi:hypothetical protein